jgi:hypothetical protein
MTTTRNKTEFFTYGGDVSKNEYIQIKHTLNLAPFVER